MQSSLTLGKICFSEYSDIVRQRLDDLALLQPETELERIFNKILEKRKSGIFGFVSFILNEHPPLHATTFDAKAFWRDSFTKIDKKTLIKLLRVYHPDKVDPIKFSNEYFLIVEEISKCLGEAINKLK